MEYVEHNGGLWRMSKRNLAKLTRVIKDGGCFDMDEFGKMVTIDVKRTRDLGREDDES